MRITNNMIDAAYRKAQAVLSKEALAEKNANKTGELIELSFTGNGSINGRSLCF